MLMPLLAAIAAFGVLRSGQLFIRAAIALAFGFAYFIVDNLLLAMGQFGRMPPSLSAWAPLFLFLTAGLLVLVYSEE
jgi:lipopolysaccharide export system permease protein